MKTIARWRDGSGNGREHLVLNVGTDGIVADAVVLTGSGDEAFAAHYRIACDRQWRTRRLDVEVIGDDRRIAVTADGAGNWTDPSDGPLPDLQGAIDVDLSVTPFTNTLPIRRLGLRTGEAAEIIVVYIRFPDLSVTTHGQRYTCLELGKRYRFESLDSDFTRDLEVDDKRLVVTYPGLFLRIQ
jgi:hypothetical protein